MTSKEILEEIERNFETGQKRKFLPGLLISFIGFLQQLGATGGKFKTLEEFYVEHPRRMKARTGGSTTTLIVFLDREKTEVKDKSLSIRVSYDKILRWFHADQKRFDYPGSAPHSTGLWADYTHWLEALLRMDDAELDALVAAAKQFVLDRLPAQIIDPNLKREPPRFQLFLEEFDLRNK